MGERPRRKVNWWALLGLLGTVLGMCLSVFLYVRSLQSREPVFVVSRKRTRIVDRDAIGKAPIQVVRHSGEVINDHISSAVLYFWNAGGLSIRPEHVLEPLVIMLDGEDGEIIDWKVMHTSRPVIGFSMRRDEEQSKRKLCLDFAILEESDGAVIQIIYAGEPSAQFKLTGAIEGVRRVIDSSFAEKSAFWGSKSTWQGVAMLISSVAGVGFVLFILLFVKYRSDESDDDEKKEANRRRELYARVIILTMIFIVIGSGLSHF
jgi:hypothetical protein